MTHVSSKVASDASKPIAPSGLPFPVVGIGASAGGIEAVKQFFEHMPQNSEMAFVVILHLSPRHESNVDKIVQRITRMPVLQVSETVAIEKNHIYVISPAMQLEMSDGHLHVSSAIRPREKHIAIDLFFRTLADAHREQAFAIVLSGTGSDGCNDPAEPAQIMRLMRMPRPGFSWPTPGVGAGGCKSVSSRQ